ncbi:hypothetical protein AJ80_05401 [Polytolypa hystricis UAMH7299]|uniref:Cytoskeleton organization protein n=1 Tax=Polytolypa hystricis (strain UAMH7299) TaxID=1447883 RepID=A0A2B7Y3Q4_POLH7|nr:hypothetical protein AJ80_05401 [Polytolypa hystricis UAMH7299]
MSSAAVFERRNKQIQDAIDAQNLKQALQLCDKRLKKGEDSHFLKAWKAHILFTHVDDAHRQRGVAETLELCRTEPPVTDIDALDMISRTLEGEDQYTGTARETWQKAAKAKPQELDIQLRWFNLACEVGDWKTAQKAAMSLQSNFPKERKYYFWAIFMCYLISADEASSEAERKLFGTLAYRMISKAASSVPTDPKELLSPPRAIQTTEELSLLLKIFDSQARHDEVVPLLDSKHLGVESRIAQNDWLFVRAKLTNLEKAAMWKEGLAFSRELLTLPEGEAKGSALSNIQEKDDWRVWNLLLKAAQNLGIESAQEIQEFIADYIKRQPKSRNAHLASLELVKQGVEAKELSPADLLSECKSYFDRNSNKLYCFADLRRCIATLDTDLQTSFQSCIAEKVDFEISASPDEEDESLDQFKPVPAINALKFEYCFRLSFGGNKDSAVQVEFVSRCLHLYRRFSRPKLGDSPSTIESQPIDDLCLLAVMALIRFHENDVNMKPYSPPTATLIQCAGVLENLLLRSPHNYEALLLLVRVYLLLGAGSLAIKTFYKLTVKQMQYETVAHNLFTRLGSLHPQSAPPFEGLEKKDSDPLTALRHALTFYGNSENAAVYSRNVGLEHGSYVNVEESIELHKSLQNSICKKMWALEARRIQRLVGGNSTSKYDGITADTTSVVDKRSFDGFMNCEAPGKPTFEEHVRLGPLPRDHAVKAMMAKDALFTFLSTSSSQGKAPGEIDLSVYESLETNKSLQDELTSAEIDNVKVHLLLLKVIISLANKKASKDVVDDILSDIGRWLNETFTALSNKSSSLTGGETINVAPQQSASTPSSAPTWIYLHTTISLLETLKAISLFTTYAGKIKSASKPPKEKFDNLKPLVKQLVDLVKSNTKHLKSQIVESGMLGHMVNLVMANNSSSAEEEDDDGGETSSSSTGEMAVEIEALMDTASVELFCGSLMESWDEALDGVMGICASL